LTCFGAIFYLNETARFVQNDAVSCKKKKEQNSVVLSDNVPPPSSPKCAAKEDRNFCLSHLFLPRVLTPPH
jgi:hypothetical protein